MSAAEPEQTVWQGKFIAAKMNGKWVIVNVLWENKLKKDEKRTQ